jgi:hypothetical protein
MARDTFSTQPRVSAKVYPSRMGTQIWTPRLPVTFGIAATSRWRSAAR